MSNLKEIYAELKKKEELSQIDPNRIEMRIRAGMEGQIRAAQSEIPALKNQYKEQVLRNSVVMAVSGQYGSDFAAIAEKDFGTISVDFLEIVDEISDSILKRGYKDVYNTNSHHYAMDELNKIKMNYLISQLPVFQANFTEIGADLPLKAGLLYQLKKQYGGQLFTAVSREKIAKRALAAGFTGNNLPVVLFNCIVDTDTRMLNAPVASLEINDLPNNETVKETLVNIKRKLSGEVTTSGVSDSVHPTVSEHHVPPTRRKPTKKEQ